MKFLTGDLYVYKAPLSPTGQRILIRSDNGRWAILPANEDDLIIDEDIENVIMIRGVVAAAGGGSYPAALFRNGVDILAEAVLGYADNIQF